MLKKILFFAIMLFFLSSCSSELSQKSGFALGTFINIKADCSEEILRKVFSKIDEIEKTCSLTIPNSELSELNKSAFNNPVKVSEELFALIETGLYYSDITGGAFDITLGKLSKLWGFGTEKAAVPSTDEIGTFLKSSMYEQVLLDKKNLTIEYTNENIEIDLGGIAKGYACDKVSEILIQNGVKSAIIDLGGNIFTIGKKQNGSSYTTGITNPKEPDKIIAALKTENKSIVTSGNYQRFFEQDGIIYHHILDGKTGFPAESGVSGVTIIAPKSIDADCLSTAAFVLGTEKGLDLINRIDGIEAIFITNNLKIITSDGIDSAMIEVLNEN